MNKDDERKRFEGILAAVDDAILAATRAEVAEELRALGIDPGTAAAAMRARIDAAVRGQRQEADERRSRAGA
jgi:hypothetical protein